MTVQSQDAVRERTGPRATSRGAAGSRQEQEERRLSRVARGRDAHLSNPGAFASPERRLARAHLDIEDVIGQFRSQLEAKTFKATEKMLAKARTHDSMKAIADFAETYADQNESDYAVLQTVVEDGRAGAAAAV